MKILELFAGHRCMGRAAETLGHEVFSVDWKDYGNINLVIDIEKLSPGDIPFIPDHIHASPDCSTYSVLALRAHRFGVHPASDYALKCDRINKHVLDLIALYQSLNPALTYTIENPRGMLRKMPFMQGMSRYTVWYCQYGDIRAKPTDIWTDLDWRPRPECSNGNKSCHHQSSPRGFKESGTIGLADSGERSLIPLQLCAELMGLVGNKKQVMAAKIKREQRVDLRVSKEELVLIDRLKVKKQAVTGNAHISRSDVIILAVKFALGESDLFKESI